MTKNYKEECWKRYLENQKYEKYDKEDLVDEIIELQAENQQLKEILAKIKDLNTMSYLNEKNFKYSLNEILKGDSNYD